MKKRELTEMEKEIFEVENKYSLYYKTKKAYDDLYRISTTIMLVVMAICFTSLMNNFIEDVLPYLFEVLGKIL